MRMQRRKQVRVVTGSRVVDPLPGPTQPICILNLNFHWDIEVVLSLFIGDAKLGDIAELQDIQKPKAGSEVSKEKQAYNQNLFVDACPEPDSRSL